MNIVGRIAIAGGAVAVGGVAVPLLHKSMGSWASSRMDPVNAETVAARREWEQWKSKAEPEFPGLRLDTPADHARLKVFVQENPAPKWIQVKHEQYNSVRFEANSPLSTPWPPNEEMGYPMGFGAILVAAGLSTVSVSLMKPLPSPKAAVAMALGSGVAIALGGLAAWTFGEASSKETDAYAGATALEHEVEATGT